MYDSTIDLPLSTKNRDPGEEVKSWTFSVMESPVHSTFGSILRSRSTAAFSGFKFGLEKPSPHPLSRMGSLGSRQPIENRVCLAQIGLPTFFNCPNSVHRFNYVPKRRIMNEQGASKTKLNNMIPFVGHFMQDC